MKMVARRLPLGPQIPQFYAGRTVFITGATGFMGKVLIERLLSTCPDIGLLFLLLREKKDVPPEKRLLQLKQTQVFDVLRQKNPGQLDKLRVIPGDVEQPGLGISAGSLAELHEVSVVFHSAATVKFDEQLCKAVDQNVRSVIRLMDICDQLPNMEAFVHVSTAYSNAELSVVEERVYPPPVELGQLLALVDAVPAHLLAHITNKYIEPKPNTYTFTKAMAEIAVQQHGNTGYPVAIFRPTIVVSSYRHPFPGWIENLNGPSGVVVSAGKGLLHALYCKTSAHADMLPVDIAIDALIAIGWETAIDKSQEVRVYNCSTNENPTTWNDFEVNLRRNVKIYPLDKAFWYPSGKSFENSFALKCYELVSQTLPLHVAEYGARLFGIKTQLSFITVSQRLSTMNEVLKFFSIREWQFHNERMRKLRERLSPQDSAIYNLDPNSIVWEDLYLNFVKGARKYLLKEKDQDLEKAKQHLRKMYILHNTVKTFTVVLFLRLILQNTVARNFVYGLLRLLLSLFNTMYLRIMSPA